MSYLADGASAGPAHFRDRILSIRELEDITGKDARTIRRWRKNGRLKNAGPGIAGVWLSDFLRAFGRHEEADALLHQPAEEQAHEEP